MSANNTTELCNDKLSEDDFNIYVFFSWWFEYFLQTGIGVAGLFANTLAIPILCSREMNSIFNRLLIFLAIFDNLYIICSVLESRRKHIDVFDQLHEYAFGYILYPLHNFVLCCSIYVTVALALERYRAVWRPVEYHNKCKGVDPWRRVITSYVMPVVIFSILFNIPKFFEVKFVVKSVPIDNRSDDFSNETGGISNFTENENRTLASPTDLRLEDLYVIFYVNAARLLVQGVIPFICLSLLNYRIYWVIKRRRQLVNRPPQQQLQQQTMNGRSGDTFSSAQRKANEAQQAIVLFIIVLLFFICHTPRFILNIHEFLTLETLRKSIEQDCNGVSIWALSFASVSHCLMTLNSSINFFIYCFMCSTFRQVLFRWARHFTSCCIRKRASTSSSPTTADVSRYLPADEMTLPGGGGIFPAAPNGDLSTDLLEDNNIDNSNVAQRRQNPDDVRPLVHFHLAEESSKGNGEVAETNGRLANREAAEMLKKKKPKRDSGKRVEMNETVTTECSISDDVSDNKFLETSL